MPESALVGNNDYALVNRDDVRPYIDQPRKKFDHKKLNALARSIAEKGQLVPVIIKELTPGNGFKYELIAGERRHRACGMVGVNLMKAVIVVVQDAKEQHLLSVMENFNRVECSIMETARSARRIKDDYEWSDEKIGEEVYGKSGAWVSMLLSLLKLHPQVQAMIDEDDRKKKLPFTLAVEIAKKIPEQQQEEQLKIAKKIVSGEIKSFTAKAYIAKRSAELGVVHKEKQRRPDDDYQVLSGIPQRATSGLSFFTKKGQPGISRIFKTRNHVDRENFVGELNELIAEANRLKYLISMVD
ncbi:MAG: hypothetical protein ACD_56C00090G0002 [uncultured bacterium]|nr:MAG: hypothetical protein ACD_56C00090G0002 [uncultured bacterium]